MVACAAANVAVDTGANLLIGGIDQFALKFTSAHHHARRAEAALQRIAATPLAARLTVCVFGSAQRGAAQVHGIPTLHTGHLHDDESLIALYAAADVFAAPSLQDNLPNTVMEAAACGLPTVAFDIGGMRDLVRHRETGWLAPPRDAVHVAFGNVLGTDRKMLKSRTGESMKFVELLDEALERAGVAVDDKNPNMTAVEREYVVRAIGIGAVKYAELSTDRVKDYVFDWDRMLSFDGNTGPYLQYAHARICSIFRRADVDRSSVRSTSIAVDAPQERELALRLLAYPTAIESTLDTFSPHKLCTYVYDLASDFTAFYEHCPVLKADEPVRSSRLALADLTARTLAHSLGLLGIDAPEQM